MPLECIPCMVGSFAKLLNSSLFPDDKKEPAMRQVLSFLADADYQRSPAALGGEMHRLIRSLLENPDPYRAIKLKYNKMIMDQYPQFKQKIENASNPFDAAMRLAIAGNVIDFGSQNSLDIMDTIRNVLDTDLAIDDSSELEIAIGRSQSFLYIGDNCGEIVFDKLFIETINHPNVTFAVRARPVINDVTIEDAKMVGLDKLANVITTGDDMPGAVWETSSEEFKRSFRKADVIIAKGQGNLEGLLNITRSYYSLLVVKCDFIARHVHAQVGDYVVKRMN